MRSQVLNAYFWISHTWCLHAQVNDVAQACRFGLAFCVCFLLFFFFFHKSSLLPLSGSQGASDEVGVYGGQPHGALVVPVGQFGEDP